MLDCVSFASLKENWILEGSWESSHWILIGSNFFLKGRKTNMKKPKNKSSSLHKSSHPNSKSSVISSFCRFLLVLFCGGRKDLTKIGRDFFWHLLVCVWNILRCTTLPLISLVLVLWFAGFSVWFHFAAGGSPTALIGDPKKRPRFVLITGLISQTQLHTSTSLFNFAILMAQGQAKNPSSPLFGTHRMRISIPQSIFHCILMVYWSGLHFGLCRHDDRNYFM